MLPDKNYSNNVSNLLSVKQLKQEFITKLGDKGNDLSFENLRFFCLGKELQDDLYLYSYDLTDEITIQCMLRKK
jgi:hypothetical protein